MCSFPFLTRRLPNPTLSLPGMTKALFIINKPSMPQRLSGIFTALPIIEHRDVLYPVCRIDTAKSCRLFIKNAEALSMMHKLSMSGYCSVRGLSPEALMWFAYHETWRRTLPASIPESNTG